MADSDFGRYDLVERLAVRAATELFVVQVSGEHGFRRHIVLKQLRDDTRAATFIEDAKLSAKLSHAKIVHTLELGSIGAVPYVAMDYVEGVDLLGLLRVLARTRRMLEPGIAAWIAQELLDALDYAHTFSDGGEPTPIVHGRLSPSKVLLGERGEVKLCDFGVAWRFDVSRSDGHDVGHLSPEQVMEQAIDPRSDVFGVGVLLAEMLMRKRLFAAHNDFDVLLMVRDVQLSRLELAGVDVELVSIVHKALEKKPEKRWQTAADFRDALDAWLFTKRASGMKQRLAALVGEVRDDVDTWRRSGSPATPELDCLPDVTDPMLVTPATVRTIAIPPKPTDRPTVELEAGEVRARGTEASPPLPKPEVRARGTVASRPLAKPARPHYHRESIPALPRKREPGVDAPPGASPPLIGRVAGAKPSSDGLEILPSLPLRAPDDGGDFARTSPLRVVFHLIRARATGLLVVTAGSVRKDVYVREGHIAGVCSSDASDLFGRYLVAHKVLSDGELAMALAMMPYYDGKIGDTLVGLGLLDRAEISRQLARHERTRIIDLCTSSTGHYAWYAGTESPRVAFTLEANGFPMLVEAALALRSADTIGPWLVNHRDTSLVVVKTQRVATHAFANRTASDLLARVDGVRTLGNLVDSHLDPEHAARILYLLVACDLVRFA